MEPPSRGAKRKRPSWHVPALQMDITPSLWIAKPVTEGSQGRCFPSQWHWQKLSEKPTSTKRSREQAQGNSLLPKGPASYIFHLDASGGLQKHFPPLRWHQQKSRRRLTNTRYLGADPGKHPLPYEPVSPISHSRVAGLGKNILPPHEQHQQRKGMSLSGTTEQSRPGCKVS